MDEKLNLLPGEDARQVDGFPLYRVTSHGRVISLHTGKPRVLRPRPHRAGYKIVTLCNDGAQMTSTIHRLIAAAFVANPDGLPVVRHLDGDKANNAAVNLAWGTYADNEADKIEHGRKRYGAAKMKLDRAAREAIRAAAAQGASRGDLAAQYGVDRSTITRLINGSTWSDRKWPVVEKDAEQ